LREINRVQLVHRPVPQFCAARAIEIAKWSCFMRVSEKLGDKIADRAQFVEESCDVEIAG